jgi:hypothetical protein
MFGVRITVEKSPLHSLTPTIVRKGGWKPIRLEFVEGSGMIEIARRRGRRDPTNPDATPRSCELVGPFDSRYRPVLFSTPLPSGLHRARDANPVVRLHPSPLVCRFNCLAHYAETFATAKGKHGSPIEFKNIPQPAKQ